MRFLTIFLVLFSLKICGQIPPSKPIILNFEKVGIETITQEIEKQSGCHFYYEKYKLDSLTFSINESNISLDQALNSIFSSKKINYSIDQNLNIFLSIGEKLIFELPESFFENISNNLTVASKTDTTKAGNPQKWANSEFKLYEIGEKSPTTKHPTANIDGHIIHAKQKIPAANAAIFVDNLNIGTHTDAEGYYTLTLPKGRHILQIKSAGIPDTRRLINVLGDGNFSIEIMENIVQLAEVTVTSQRESNVKSMQMGLQKVDIKTIKQVPVLFGEADILKVITSLPGVKTVGEASTGLNVRGGSTDQNLILYNETPIMNPYHFFGMFSAFNPEIVKDVELFKSSIPARYGGRLSSVLNINSIEGNGKKISGSAGIGLLTSRLTLEGPIGEKTNFVLAGRTTYANWLLNLLPEPYNRSKANFYDINFNISHQINRNNKISLTSYLSDDSFNLSSDTLFKYGNRAVSANWNHIFDKTLSANIIVGFSKYNYQINSGADELKAYKLSFDLQQSFVKVIFTKKINLANTLEYGINGVHYQFNPGNYAPASASSLVIRDRVPMESALESAVFISDSHEISQKLNIDGGLRFSMFNYLGPHDIHVYEENLPKTEGSLSNTIVNKKGVLKTYLGPEFRISARYLLNNNASVKAGINTQKQYIHAISNTAAIAPTDIWKLSDTNIRPQNGAQISLGLYQNFLNNSYETSVEVYYKKIKNYLDYKSGAQLILNQHLETDVMATKGKAYGAEFLIKKTKGKLNGWLSYTYSRILLKTDDPLAGELINKGHYYPANYDKPHDITIVANYKFSHRITSTLSLNASTGRPITLPSGVYNYAGSIRTLYFERNGYRIPNYFRSDFSLNIDGNHKIRQKTHNFWNFGVYNITGRKNPYSVYFISENGRTNGYKLSIFGSAIPFINYNIKF